MAGLLVAVTLLAAVSVVLAAPHTEVPVGVLLSDPDVTEPSAVFRGLELAAQQLTAAGLPVRLIAEDPAPNAAAAALRLIADGAVAIVGAGTSGDTIRAAEAHAIPRSVVMISPAATAPAITDLAADRGRDLLFRTVAPDTLQGRVAGTLAAERWDTAAILHVDNQYGAGLAEHFRAAYEAAGGRVVAQVGHPEPTSGSYAAELRAVLAGGPDVVAAYSYSRHAEVYVKEAAEMFGFRTFLFADGTKSLDLLATAGADTVEGLVGTAPGLPSGPANAAFVRQYRAEYGDKPPLPFIENAYDALAVIGLAAFRALAAGEQVTGSSVRDHLRAVAGPPGRIIGPGDFARAFALLSANREIDYQGASGPVDFDAAGDVTTSIEIWRFNAGGIESLFTREVEQP